MKPETLEIRPQEKQELFLSTPADIAIYGGGAGGGKTFGLLLEPLRHKDVKDFGAVIFRRTSPQITNEGGLWDESGKLYPFFSAKPKTSPVHSWTFPKGATISFSHLQHEKNVFDWQGSQIPFIAFDELTHFTEYQFFYMMSRNRSTCGIRPYIRANCNPDPDSWVKKFISFWLDKETGFPIAERAGVLRYFVRHNNELFWADSPSDLIERFPHLYEQFGDAFYKSATFIPATIYDNPALLDKDPNYLANLLALPLVEREQLLGGNWNVRLTAGKFFNRAWFEVLDALPANEPAIDCRFWDFASTAKELGKNDPDFSAGVLMRFYPRLKIFVILDSVAVQSNPADVYKLFFETAKLDRARAKRDGSRYMLRWEIEGGSASKRESHSLTSKLIGYDAKGVRDNRDKLTRARALAIQTEAGNVGVVNTEFTESYLNHMHGVPDLPHDDIFDASSGAFNSLVKGLTSGARSR